MWNTALCLVGLATVCWASAEALSDGGKLQDTLFQMGILDVTRPPYSADPTGVADSTTAIQRAVNDARDHWLVCFFPEGTYLISDTISCQQEVRKLDKPRHTDGQTQHYWDLAHRIVMIGSTKRDRPVIKLSDDARGFDDPARPKLAIWIWAQTRHDAPGKDEPVWGKEQPNISFNHIFRGIDIDIRGHAGAIGIRHSGSQGSTLQDCTIYAEGAYAGMNNCPGQGGGTYNIDVLSGRYGIVLEPQSRFPLLTSCTFRGQTEACIRYSKGGSQIPTLLVGCLLEPNSGAAIDLTTERRYAGVSMVDCVVTAQPGDVVCRTRGMENLFLENCFLKDADAVCTEGKPFPESKGWILVERYSSHTGQSVNLVNGRVARGEIIRWTVDAPEPAYADLRQRHYTKAPSFENEDVVNVKVFGAKGDGTTDDTAAFRRAIAANDKIFIPKGNYQLTDVLCLRRNTQLFGLSSAFCTIGDSTGAERFPGVGEGRFSVITEDSVDAAPGLFFLGIRGRIEWRSGQGRLMLTPGSLEVSGHAGGRLYGVMAMRRPLALSGIKQPMSLYALNVERVSTNPQSEIRDSSHIRVYYTKCSLE